MKIKTKNLLKLVMTFCICWGVTMIIGSTYAQSTDDILEVKKLCQKQVVAFNNHDLDAFLSGFHNDIEMHTQMTGWLRGFTTVKSRFVQVFEQNPDAKMEIEETNVRSIASNTMIVDFKWIVYPAPNVSSFKGTTVGVYVKRDGKWGEVFEMEQFSNPPPSTK